MRETSLCVLMVEDVQMTKDDVPVIYHDFLMSETGTDAPVHHLTLDQVFPTSFSVLRISVCRLTLLVHVHQRCAVQGRGSVIDNETKICQE